MDEVADAALRKVKNVIKPIGRLLLLSTFLEDGIRMFTQWGEQTTYIKQAWSCGSFLAISFVLFNLIFQLIPCAMILGMRKNVKMVQLGVACLVLVVIVQSLAYTVLWDAKFFLRNIAVIGALVLVYAETQSDAGKSMFGQLPSMGENRSLDYMQLSGRIMLLIMMLTLAKFDTVVGTILTLVNFSLLLCVAVGLKTKPAALALVVLMTCENLFINNFWSEYAHSAKFDFKKYDFFQTMSVVGGLCLVVALGPGGVSMDESKKKW